MADNQNLYVFRTDRVHHAVREDFQSEGSVPFGARRANFWIVEKNFDDVLKFLYEPCGKNTRCLSLIKCSSFRNIALCRWVQDNFQAGNRASSRATTSSYGSGCTEPLSNSD